MARTGGFFIQASHMMNHESLYLVKRCFADRKKRSAEHSSCLSRTISRRRRNQGITLAVYHNLNAGNGKGKESMHKGQRAGMKLERRKNCAFVFDAHLTASPSPPITSSQ
jgi:hypothetical protein